MSLGKEIAKLKFDKRMTEWHVNQGKLAKDDLKKHLDALPDLAANIDHVGLTETDNGDDMPATTEEVQG